MSRDSHTLSRHKHYVVCHDLFWPRIELKHLRECLGLASDVSDTQLELAARASMDVAAREFADWRRRLRERGYRRLSDVAGHEQGRALSTCYLRRVQAQTRWSLAHQFRETVANGGSRTAVILYCPAGGRVSSSRRRSS